MDGQLRLRGEYMLEQPLNLDARYVWIDANARGFPAGAIGANISFELLGRSRLREQRFQLVQVQPPTAAGLGDVSSENVTKYRTLTVFSAPRSRVFRAVFSSHDHAEPERTADEVRLSAC